MGKIKLRHKILFGVVLFLIGWIIFWEIIPVGSGNWNGKQITNIKKAEESAKNKDKFCFAVMGDNKNSFKTFQRIISDVNQKNPVFAIDIGDLVFDGEKEKYRIFYDEIQKSKVPFLVAIGNHDVRENGRDNYYKIFGDFYYAFSYGNSLFIVLDDANEKYIDEQQMSFLKTELKRNFQHKFVFMHVPPFDPRAYLIDILHAHKKVKLEHCLSDKKNAQEFMDLMEEYKVTAVFTSHIHAYYKEKRNGVLYFITGGAGAEMFLSNPEHYFYHYINVCVNNDKVNYQVVKFPSPDANLVDHFFYSMWLIIWYFVITHRPLIILLVIVTAFLIDISYERKSWQQEMKKRSEERQKKVENSKK